jgi:hypothetical protein
MDNYNNRVYYYKLYYKIMKTIYSYVMNDESFEVKEDDNKLLFNINNINFSIAHLGDLLFLIDFDNDINLTTHYNS